MAFGWRAENQAAVSATQPQKVTVAAFFPQGPIFEQEMMQYDSEQMKRNKALERFYVEHFLRACDIGYRAIADHEPLDFLIDIGGELVGIELTQAFAPSGGDAALVTENLTKRIVSKAQKLHIDAGARPAHVVVKFQSGLDVRSLNRDETSARLADLVKSLNLAPFERISIHSWQRPLPVGVASVFVSGVPEYRMGHWQPSRAAWLQPMTEQVIQACIDAKALRLANYRKLANQVWLVVMTDSMRVSGAVELSDSFDETAFDSPFDKTYFYLYPERKVTPLGPVTK